MGRSIVKEKHSLAPSVRKWLGTSSSKVTRGEAMKLYWKLIKKKGLQFKSDGRWHTVPPGLSSLISMSGLVESGRDGSKTVKGIYISTVPKIISRLFKVEK